MNELTEANKNLPVTLKDLTRFVLVGREKLVSVRAEIRAIDKMGIATGVREQKREEAQMLAGALLDAETRIGELIKKLPEGERLHTSGGGSMPKLPCGISHKQSHFFQTLAENKDIVEQVKREAVENDDLPTRTEVLRKVAHLNAEKKIDAIRSRETKPAHGKYDVVIIDPPWPMEKIERDCSPEQVKLDYPTMTIDEIKQITIPKNENCHLFLWTTHKFLPVSFEVISSWGFNYVCCFVWHKNGGFQPFNLPQYNNEFVIYARSGSPKFTETKSFFTCFDAKRTGHSEKPDEFYDVIKRVTSGKRIDVFNRRKIDGFDAWGNES